ncbi:MAG: DNA polymerase III subunit beta [Candidatus Omnitrophica bacterium]|nr:DNA polymerase III subunit beta [Candidatus Omnitrophota bacterium]
MYLKINKETLVTALQKIQGPTTTKQNFPILNGIKFLSTNNRLKLTTTDLDTTLITTLEADIIKEGDFVVPMKRLFPIIKELPPQELEIEKIKNNLSIKCGKIEFKINTLNSQEFPQVQEPEGVSLIKLDSQVIEEMIKLTSFCVGVEDVNYVLNGILFEIEKNTIKLISTDGKRLAFVEKSLPQAQPEVSAKVSFILPIRAINEIFRLVKDSISELFLSVEANRIGFDLKDTQIFTRPIEGEFPDYTQYIPAEGKDRLVIDRKTLFSALKRASLLSTPDYQGIKLEVKRGAVVVEKNTPQMGEVKEEMEAEYKGTSLEIGFNPNYLMDVLRSVDDDLVSFDFFGPDKPAVFRKQGYVYLLLPIKL